MKKPKVRYYTSKGGIRYKETLLLTVTGEDADRINVALDTCEGGIHWHYEDDKEPHKMEIWSEDTISID